MTRATIYEAPRPAPRTPGETVVTTTCGHNCGGRCVVNAHVRDGRIVKISTDTRPWDPAHPPLPACARAVGQIERTSSPGPAAASAAPHRPARIGAVRTRFLG